MQRIITYHCGFKPQSSEFPTPKEFPNPSQAYPPLISENGSKMIRTQWSINENSHYWHPDYIPNPIHNGSNPKPSWMIDNWRTIISYNLKLILIITDYGRSSQKMKESPSIVSPQQLNYTNKSFDFKLDQLK